ncbi:membrane protein [Arthrobacter nitrophenolicus]|nr:membrane protein [Arthrobacter nitrophenolicus]
MKLVALGLLVAMAVVFVIAFALQDEYPWLQYVRAAAEGGMVGALADWFAVTALFKYPMGIKIPHTAIIPRRKDQIGASLGEFVETNFLSEQVVQEKLASVNIARRAGEWLATPAGANRVAKEGAALIRGAFKVLNDDDVQAVIEGMVRKHLLAPPWGPPVGRMAERIFHDGHHHKLVDLLVDRAADWVDDNHETVTRLVSDRSPTWVPQFVDGLVGDKVYVEILKFVRAVQADPNHQVRQQIDKYLNDLAQDLQHDPAMIARAEEIKAQVLGDPEVRELASRTWGTVKNALLGAVEDPDSDLTIKFKAAVRDFGSRLVNDPELAGKVNAWIGDAAGYLVRTYRSDIAGVITDTVARWDAEETSQKIELQVGKDLQFIRINGTVVGSLAGLAIFTAAHLVFG